MEAVREATRLPVLAKDFFVTAYQIYEARVHGADAVLLIVAALSDDRLREFRQLATELGLAALGNSTAQSLRGPTSSASITGTCARSKWTWQ